MAAQSDDILAFWFGPDHEDAATALEQMPRWFSSDKILDAEIHRRFLRDYKAALAGERATWEQSAPGRLALIILLDQFPRNMFRGTAQAFAADRAAQRICLQGLEAGQDRDLNPIERGFFYLPLQHAEDLTLQEASVHQYARLLQESGSAWQPVLQNMLDYALEHRDIILRFGRFPHRNLLLSRPSTLEEQEFLADGGPDYGQA